MKINRLINDYYLDKSLQNILHENNEKLKNGVEMEVSQGILLDYFKSLFYFHQKTEFLSKEILKYKYFFSEDDRFDITVKDDTGKILISISNSFRDKLIFGSDRSQLLRMGWIFCSQRKHTITVKKHENYFFLDNLLFDEEYLSELVLGILNTNKFRTEALRIKTSELTSNFYENLLYLDDKFSKYSKNEVFKKQLKTVINSLKYDHEITPALNLIGVNHSDLWASFKPD